MNDMKNILTTVIITSLILSSGCSKQGSASNTLTIPIPNGDFESWQFQEPLIWQHNSCPPCLPPFETYIVRQDTSAYQGQFAAKLLYNNVYPATVQNMFFVAGHPNDLTAFVKTNMAANDSVTVKVKLYKKNSLE